MDDPIRIRLISARQPRVGKIVAPINPPPQRPQTPYCVHHYILWRAKMPSSPQGIIPRNKLSDYRLVSPGTTTRLMLAHKNLPVFGWRQFFPVFLGSFVFWILIEPELGASRWVSHTLFFLPLIFDFITHPLLTHTHQSGVCSLHSPPVLLPKSAPPPPSYHLPCVVCCRFYRPLE